MKSKLFLILILIFAFLLRIYGLNWDQNQHLHPDERFLTMVLTEVKIPNNIKNYLDPQVSTLNPYNHNFDFFVYGTLPLNLVKIIGHQIGLDDYVRIHFVGRVLSALFDVGVVIIIFFIAKNIFNEKVGLMSSLLYSITVLPIQLSHFYTVDPFLNFFIVLTFYFLVKFVQSKSFLKYSLLLGFSFGCGLGCKISAVYFLPVIFLVYLYRFIVILINKKHILKNINIIIIGGLIFILLSAFTFRFNQPQAFRNGNYLNWSINPQFVSNIKTLQYYDRPDSLFPPGIQWFKTTPVIFPLKNLILWGLGLPLGIMFLISLIFSCYLLIKNKLKTKSQKTFLFSLIIFWVIGLFLYQGSQTVKTMRYFLPIYPFISIIIGQFIIYLSLKKNSVIRSKLFVLFMFILILIYPLSFLSIYQQDSTRVTASKWICQNINPGSTIATEYWDDALPLPVEGFDYGIYQNKTLSLYDPDTLEKWQKISNQLSQSDYIVLSSNRLLGSIPKNPEIYPVASKYYHSLFNGSLGFKKIIEFTSRPCFKIFKHQLFCLNDDDAEEAFTVYDHPKVIIFKNISYSENNFSYLLTEF